MEKLKEQLKEVSSRANCIAGVHIKAASIIGCSPTMLYQVRTGINPQFNNNPTKESNLQFMRKCIDAYEVIIEETINELKQ